MDRIFTISGDTCDYKISLGDNDKCAIYKLSDMLDSVINTFMSYCGMEIEEVVENIKIDCGFDNEDIRIVEK